MKISSGNNSSSINQYIVTKLFKVKIARHTPLIFQNSPVNMWHVNKVGKVIKVREVEWPSAFYETKTGESILKTDCDIILSK